MKKSRKKNTYINSKKRIIKGGLATLMLASGVVPALVVSMDKAEAQENSLITKGVFKNSTIEVAYQSNGSTVKLLNLSSAKNTTLNLPNEIDGLPVTEIAPYFTGNLQTVFTSITLPSQLEKIGDFAFNTATVTELTLPSSLKYIGESAFAVSLIKNLTIPQSVEYMGARAFEKSPLTSLSFESGSRLETIDMYTFYYAKLTSLTLPENLKRINTGAFYYSPLTNLNLNDGLEVIENRGFSSAQLTSINFPSTLRLVGGNAFKTSSFGISTANGYENIVWNEPIWNDEQSVFGSRTNELRNALKAKESVFTGLNYSLSYRIVGDEVFISQLESLTEDATSLEIPDYIDGKKVVYIGNRFSEKISTNSKIQKLRLPAYLEEVGGYAFDKLLGITEMNYPSTLTKLGAGAFRKLQLTSLEIPEGVEELSDSTFNDSPLTELRLPSTLRKINYNAFYKAKLTNISIPNSVEMIGNGAFYSSELAELTLPNSLEIIQGSAFRFSPLKRLVVPESVKQVSLSAFLGASLDYLEIRNPNITHDQYSTDITKIYNLNTDATIKLVRDSTTHKLPGTTNYNLSFIGENTAPLKISDITNQKINQDQELTIDLSKHFTDSDDDTLTYEITVSDSKGVVTLEGNTLKFISNTAGDYSVTVKATDGSLYSEETTFKVTVEETDIAPTVLSSLENNKEYKNQVTPTFDIKNATNVEYMLNGNPYILGTPITNKGENKLVVVASNDSKTTTQTYTFIIVSNEPPKAVKQIADQTVVKDEILKFNLNDYFTDAEGDTLTFNARTSDDVASRVWIFPEGELKFTSAYIDQYTITVSATDGIGSSEELSFTVDVVDQQVEPPTEPPKVPVEEGKLPPVTNYKLVENIPLVGIGTKKTIFIDGLLNEFDLDKLSPTIKTTDGKTVDTVYDSENKTLTFEALKSGFSNVQVQLQDEAGNKAALLFMIDVYEASNTSPNYIANGSIKLGTEAYVVKLDEVYADVSNSESVTYQVSVTKDGEDHPEEVQVEEKASNNEEIMNEETIENQAETEIQTESPDSEISEEASTEEAPTENEAVPSLEEENLTTPATIGVNRKGLLASLNMMPFVNVANNDTDTFVFEVPAGVSTTTLHDDDNLNIRLVNGKLVVEGKQVGMYNVTVQAETTTGSIASPVNFSLAVLPPDITGGGSEGGNTGGGNNGGSEGGNTGGGNNGGSEGGSAGGGNNGDSEGGSTGGGNNGDSEGGSTGGGNNGDSEGGSTGGGNNGGSEGGGTGGGNNGGSEGGGTGGENNGGSEGGSTSEGNNSSDSGNTGEGNNETDKDSSTTPGGKLEEIENGDLVLDIQPGKPSIKDTVDIVVDEDSIQLTIDGKQYDSKISNGLSNYDKKRVIREEGKGVYSTVPHYNTDDNKLKITTKNPYGLVITDRVAVPFKDVKGLFSFDEVEELYNYLIVNGTTASTFSPNKDLKRGEFSAMLARALELSPESKKYHFKDVNVYKKEVQALYEAGIITGFPDGSFGESKTLTRQEAAAMIGRMLNYMDVDTETTENISLADMNKVSDYAKDAVQYLASQDVLVSGQDTKFNPMDNLTRAQMAKILMRSLRLSNWY